MAKLADLNANFGRHPIFPNAQRLSFLCPKCKQRIVCVDIWGGKAGDLQVGERLIKLWHADQSDHGDLSTLSITPSIDTEHNSPSASGCEGWHGYITNGEAA